MTESSNQDDTPKRKRRRREVILMGYLTDEEAEALAKAEMSPEHLRFYDDEPDECARSSSTRII